MESVIDTSVLVDYILLDSELHGAAKAGLEKITRGFLPSVVLEELASVLDRLKIDKGTINEKIEEVLETYEVCCVSGADVRAAGKIIMKEPSTSFKRFNDKLILSIAKERSLPLFTFDRELARECKANSVEVLQEL
ncbi:MAG TPA: PIN domain-containing protein [Candidatus Saccharimonadales bacterium]|nr:PIN domain-containing protein [Candidatus Saccharimonadales bacterium]